MNYKPEEKKMNKKAADLGQWIVYGLDGWRGYPLPVLETRFTGFVSSLILGVIWTM